jgi:hypothetical protein
MEKVDLSGEVIAALYANKLVSIEPQSSGKYIQKEEQIPFTGGFQKRILWLHASADHPFLNNEDHEMVTKILEACRLGWQDIALINLSGNDINPQTVFEKFDPGYLICSVPEMINQYLPQETLYILQEKNGVTLLSTDSLDAIRNDKQLKIKLWQALKNMFGL